MSQSKHCRSDGSGDNSSGLQVPMETSPSALDDSCVFSM